MRDIYEENSGVIQSVLFHFTGNWQEAQEITQETFIKYSIREKELCDHPNIRAWLFKVALNEARGLRRRARTLKRLLDGFILGDEKNTSSFELEAELKQLLSGLDQEHREILLLKYLGGFSYEEISEMTGKAEGTLRSTVSRTLQSLNKGGQHE